MTFWQQVQVAAYSGFVWIVLVFVLCAVLLSAIRPGERARIRNGLFLFALSFLGLSAVAVLGTHGAGSSSLYRWLRWASLLCQSLALVNLASVLIFEVVLDSLRLKPPRIMRDLLLAF